MSEQRAEAQPSAQPSRAERVFGIADLKIPFLVALAEGVVVAATDIALWTALAVAVLVLVFHFWKGRLLERPLYRRISWGAATSQALVILAVVVAAIVGWFVLILVGALAAGALYLLLTDRPSSR